MKQIRELGRIFGNFFTIANLTWTLYEIIRLWYGETVLIQDLFEFFREHPEHLPGIHIALAAAFFALLLILNSWMVNKVYWQIMARTSTNRFRAMTIALEAEMQSSKTAQFMKHSTFHPDRMVERQTIGLALHPLGIRVPLPNLEHRMYAAYLAIIIPYARVGDVKAARREAEKFISALQ